MPVTISGDALYQIEALTQKLSDDNMRTLIVELRDSLVARLGQVTWSGKISVNIGRGLTQYTEPVRTPTGGWMVGVGSLDILHRGDAPPHTIRDFLGWYRETYMPTERAKRRAEEAAALRVEAKAKIAALQRKRIDSALDRLSHIYTISLPYQHKLMNNLSERIRKLEVEMAAALYGPVSRLNEMRAQMQTLVAKRAERRQKIRRLVTETQILEDNLRRWGK